MAPLVYPSKPENTPVAEESRLYTNRLGLTLRTILRVGPIYKLADRLTSVRFVVHGNSMHPNYVWGQHILVSRIAYLLEGPCRGDVVLFHDPSRRRRIFIKRIIGLPGEGVRVEGGLVFINGHILDEPYLDLNSFTSGDSRLSGTQEQMEGLMNGWSLPEDHYFVMGDNRAADSVDSRHFGPLSRRLIIGKALTKPD
jgi:signal peptidase I